VPSAVVLALAAAVVVRALVLVDRAEQFPLV
jgi:hypothetical protein